MTLCLIVARCGKTNVIGDKNTLPWNIPSDLKRFRSLTKNRHIVMGRQTFDSIGQILPSRVSHVITTRNRENEHDLFYHPSVSLFYDYYLEHLKNSLVFVIGGSQIYQQFELIADSIIETTIDGDIKGDTTYTPNQVLTHKCIYSRQYKDPVDSHSYRILHDPEFLAKWHLSL